MNTKEILILIKDRMQGKALKGQKRSSKWHKVRKEHIKNNPKCAVCGLKTKVEVHHIIPFHITPDLELDSKNLVTLCENKKWGINCHLNIGHRGNYQSFNPNINTSIAYMKAYLDKYGD